MTDLSMTIAPKSDQINADDLIGGPRTITITRVTGNEGSPEQPVNIFFEGDNGKPYRPCKSMRRVMVAVWGADGASYTGRSMTLYRDPSVQFGGMQVGGIRISHMSHIDKAVTMALTATRANRKPYTVKPLAVAQAASPVVQDEARAQARLGTDAFRAWFRDNPGKRDAAKPIMDELKRLCTEADDAARDDPFGLPPLPEAPALSDADRERLAAEARAEAERFEREAGE